MLSAAVQTPRFLAIAATRSRSTSFSSGLVGVSIQIRRVFGRIAASMRAGVGEIELAYFEPGIERLRTRSNRRREPP